MDEFDKVSRKWKIGKLSWSLAFRLADLTLLTLFISLTLTAPSKHTGKFLAKFFRRIHNELEEERIKQVFYQLKRQGLVSYTKRLWQQPLITRQGRRRLKALLPEYHSRRFWDKRLYLITYDIPEEQKTGRDRLRQFLKKIGCGLLQESVWVTPYDPKKLLTEFARENNLSGLVLVSDLGKDGQIGTDNPRLLVQSVFKLDELNRRYREFTANWSGKPVAAETIGRFLSILKDDPQLPFDLLPDDWQGEAAWHLVKPCLQSFT